MVRPFSRKAKKSAPIPVDDEELEEVIDEVEEPIEVNLDTEVPQTEEQSEKVIAFEELSIEEVAENLKVSAQTVIKTCMDIRRGENVLIVCDPTTGDIGQALHEA
ncbi:MAG: hypothetical protein HN458_00930, partial [Euryarchaeota archaeon]|nr:hypothetical protein [Euryarchaeota archaeon]